MLVALTDGKTQENCRPFEISGKKDAVSRMVGQRNCAGLMEPIYFLGKR